MHLDKAIGINKMQHQYIQNLQKANLFLKQKVRELQDKKTDGNSDEEKGEVSQKIAVSKDNSDASEF